MKKYTNVLFVLGLLLLPLAGHATAATCSIGSFTATPVTVAVGGSATLNIKTSNCDKVKLLGLDMSNPTQGFVVQPNGSVSSGAVTSARTFTLQASAGTSTPVTTTLAVGVNPVAEVPTVKKGFFATVGSAVGMVANAIGSIFSK